MSELALRPRRRPGSGKPRPGPEWRSLTTIRRRWVAAGFAVCALFGAGVALFSHDDLHRLWGTAAAAGYLAAALAVLAWRARGLDLALLLGLSGALLVPLFWLADTGRQQPEVSVIIRSARLMVHHGGDPYQGPAVLAATHNPNLYDPYLPVMTLFGLPRALEGSGILTDPRLWFGVAFVIAFGLALIVAGAQDWLRWTALVTASPVIAFQLAVGGTDIPVLALMCLGLALLWRTAQRGPHPLLAGIVLGVDAAMKATAWPAVVIGIALLLATSGKRAAATFTAAALVACAALVGPIAVIWPHALVVNTISFPLGLAKITSAAASPLPGHILAGTGHLGHTIAVALLVLAGLGIAVSLVVRPPRNVPSATWRLFLGLVLMFTLAPSTRFGYYIYPAGLAAWLLIAQAAAAAAQGSQPEPGPSTAATDPAG